MNYAKIYNQLIERAKSVRDLDYSEKHHIVPRCMGGDNSKSNIVRLSAEEHYVAHLCLVKMYPENRQLVYAANMMCSNSNFHKRSSNKRYGWLRKRLQQAAKLTQSGAGNSNFGTCWVTNEQTMQSIKVLKTEVEQYLESGFVAGRVIANGAQYRLYCSVCNAKFSKFSMNLTCDSETCRDKARSLGLRRPVSNNAKTKERRCKHCNNLFMSSSYSKPVYCSKVCLHAAGYKFPKFAASEDKFIELCLKFNSVKRALSELGYLESGSYASKWATYVLNSRGISRPKSERVNSPAP